MRPCKFTRKRKGPRIQNEFKPRSLKGKGGKGDPLLFLIARESKKRRGRMILQYFSTNFERERGGRQLQQRKKKHRQRLKGDAASLHGLYRQKGEEGKKGGMCL